MNSRRVVEELDKDESYNARVQLSGDGKVTSTYTPLSKNRININISDNIFFGLDDDRSMIETSHEKISCDKRSYLNEAV